MDTLRDKTYLEELWNLKKLPGKFGMNSRIIKLRSFWKNKKVFITGHTGFKGSWLTIFLHLLGAKVYGYSLRQEKHSFYNFAKIEKIITKSIIGDVRNYNKLKKSIKNSEPHFLYSYGSPTSCKDIHMIFQNILMKLIL